MTKNRPQKKVSFIRPLLILLGALSSSGLVWSGDSAPQTSVSESVSRTSAVSQNIPASSSIDPSVMSHSGIDAQVLAKLRARQSKRGPNRAPLGGGSTKTGFKGEYFPNTNFEGEPSFVRRDVRIKHDWKEGPSFKGLPVGGATTPGMKDFPLDDFSIRWSGHLVSRFDEDYTFCVVGFDGARVSLAGKIVVDNLDSAVVQEITWPMKKGEKVEIVFEYVDRAGTDASEARLEWTSKSTPWEVVDPLSFAQICGHQAAPQQWNVNERADLKREVNFWRIVDDKGYKNGDKLSREQMDSDGWPMVPGFSISLTDQHLGRHMIRFTGKAKVEVGSWYHSGGTTTWLISTDGSGETYSMENSKGPNNKPMLPKGLGYDASTNTTTAWFDLSDNVVGLALIFTDAEREPGKPGIVNLQVMGPVRQNSKEYHEPGEILKREAREVFDNFTINRLHIGMSLSKGWTWEERTLPSYHARENVDGWGYCLEEYIMRINEGGLDWHICFSAGWDEDYMKKFAQMVRYGSDGIHPYDHYVENPKYPPLNPNLRIYLEHSNELPWAVYPRFIWDDLKKKVAENHPDWAIINYDKTCKGADGTAMFRYHALRMKQMSDAFRQVYADIPSAMGDRARVYCFGQYTAAHMNNMLQFLDNYFNKADPSSDYKGEPHSPNDYLWGGGGAIYYGCNNKFGLMDKELISDGGFEECDIPNGETTLRPDASGWKFTGNAGICDVRIPCQEAAKIGQLPTEPVAILNKDQWVGFKFTVGPKDLFVYQLGRWISPDHHETKFYSSRSLEMAIFDENGAKMAAYGGAPRISTFKAGGFAYHYCAEKAWGRYHFLPAYLQAGKTYYLVSREIAGKTKDRFFGPVQMAVADGLEISAAVMSSDGKQWQEKTGSLSYGPVNMLFATEPMKTAEGIVGVPPDCSEETFFSSWSPEPRNPEFKFGTQCAFLQGESSMSREFTVDEAGTYWVTFNPAMDRLSNGYKKQGWGGWTCTTGVKTIQVTVDGQEVGQLPSGGFESRGKVFHYAASSAIKLEPGKHTVTFKRINHRDGTAFIDEVHLSNEMAFYGGTNSPNFPAGGAAFGQDPATGYHRTAQAECEMALNWGLVPSTYEGGWAVQGDFDHYSMNAWNDLRYGSDATDPELTKQALRNAFDIWCRYGGYVYAYFYPVQKDISQMDAPLLQCVQELNDRLSVPQDAGTRLPGILNTEIPHSEGGRSGYSASWSKKKTPADLPAYGWKSWVVTSPTMTEYKIVVSASTGSARLMADNLILVDGDASGLTGTVRLTQGVHSIKLQTFDSAIKVESLSIESK